MYVDYNGEFVAESIGTGYLLWIGAVAISSAILNWGDEIKNAQYGRWLNTNFGKPIEKWVNKHIVKPFNNLFGGDKRPAPEVYMASMPMNAGSGGPNNLPIFGTSSAGGLGIPGGDLLRTGADFVPFVGSGLDIYEGIRDGDGWQVAMGAGFLVLDVATLGSSSLVKGAVKTGIKAGGRSLAKGAAKTGVNAVEQAAVHGNSLLSTKPTWGYKLFSNDGTFLKNGITNKLIPETRYTKAFMSDKYMEAIPFPNRLGAYQWEFGQNQILRGPLNFNMH